MPVYTVHEPPLRQGESDPARIAFVRDGFSFWAFLLGPLWMLWHRLWLAAIGYLVLATALELAFLKLGASATAKTLVGVLFAILVGLEAASLRRWTYARRGWTDLGVVVADDMNMAERRFFDRWMGVAPAAPVYGAPGAPPPRAAAHEDVLGLFPQPGARA